MNERIKNASGGAVVFLVLINLLSMASISSGAASITWSNGSGDADWNNTANWTGGILPNFTTDYAKVLMANGPALSDGQTANAYRIYLEGAGNGTLAVNGGTLNLNGSWIGMAYTAAADIGTLNIGGGNINTTGISGHIYCGVKGTATLNISGGDVNMPGGTLYIARDAGSNGTVNLSGGTITCSALSMRFAGGVGTMNITSSGKLIINNSGAANVSTYVTNGWITAYNGTGTVVVDVNNVNPGKTTIWAFAPTTAKLPSPANDASRVSVLAPLSWAGAPGATSHKIYFGTSGSPAFAGQQTGTTFNPGILNFNTNYYWRVDEVFGSNVVTGDLWSFATIGESAATPNPASSSTQVFLYKSLNWLPGYCAVSHDIYLGTDAAAIAAAQRVPGDLDGNGQVGYNDLFIITSDWLQSPAGSQPYSDINGDNIVDSLDYALLAQNFAAQSNATFKGNTTAEKYKAPDDFAPNTTYYWRVDEINGGRITTGTVWSFTTSPYAESLAGKVMCGYQGWFGCPGDGTTRGWVHWGGFAPDNCTVDMWPDMTEMTAGEKFLASSFYDGTDHYVFSSHNLATVRRHFQWMRDYGIDGVYLQRFSNEVRKQDSASFFARNDVLDYCKDAANMYGRKYAVMYDLSGLHIDRMPSVSNDWRYLVDTKRVTKDPADQAYAYHNGKPVVAVWGIGFNDGREYTVVQCLDLVNFLKYDPVYGGNAVMVGVPSYWRTLDHDSTNDVMLHTIIQTADIVSPWSVGRYPNSAGIADYIHNVWIPDVNWCRDRNIDYLPVIFPGFSWANMGNGPLNQIPRNGGQFLWEQVKGTIDAGASMIYVAMFDEVDEGTAIFKVSNNPPRPGGVDMFVTYNMDGYSLPSDEYLWLVGQARRALREEITADLTRPVRP